MTNENSIIIPYPQTSQRAYQRLMSTRDSFLRKLSTAEQRKLITSYELLINSWAQNLTEKQSSIIAELSAKLNSLLQELKNNGMSLKTSIELQVNQHISENLTKLTNEETDLQQQRQSLADIIKIWTKDIDEKNGNLKKRQRYLNQVYAQRNSHQAAAEDQLQQDEAKLKEMTKAHEHEWTNSLKESYDQLTASEQELNELLQVKEQLSNDYANLSKKSLDDLKDYSAKRQPNLTNLKQVREQQLSNYKQMERTSQSALENSLKNYESELLKPLKNEMLTELQGFPEDLKRYWMDEDISWLSRMPKVTTEGSAQLKNSLTRQLAKRGYEHINVDELVAAANSYQ